MLTKVYELMADNPKTAAVLTLIGAGVVAKMAMDAYEQKAEKSGIRLNGLHMNGMHMNGLHMNGVHKAGLHLNGAHMNGLHLNGLHLNGLAVK
jgi:hypothetical protein